MSVIPSVFKVKMRKQTFFSFENKNIAILWMNSEIKSYLAIGYGRYRIFFCRYRVSPKLEFKFRITTNMIEGFEDLHVF